MSFQKKISRRHWFRLRPSACKPEDNAETALPKAPPASGRRQSMGTQAGSMKAIEKPQSYGRVSADELPPMREALLSSAELQQLFSDIAACGTHVMLISRGLTPATANSSDSATAEIQLAKALQKLLDGTVHRIQIRYRWSQSAWIDTLECRPDGYRLVRIAHRVQQAGFDPCQ